jgi:hypothetical protein
MKQYIVTVNGIEHTMQLSDKDAKRYRDAKMLKGASEGLGEAHGGENPRKGSEAAEDPKEGSGDTKEAAKPANKSTRAANKAG